MKNNFYEELKKYFEVTPREKILEDWNKSSEFDNIGPTVEEFLNNTKEKYVEEFLIREGCQRMECDGENCNFFEDVQPKDLIKFAELYKKEAINQSIILLKQTTEYEVLDWFKEKVDNL